MIVKRNAALSMVAIASNPSPIWSLSVSFGHTYSDVTIIIYFCILVRPLSLPLFLKLTPAIRFAPSAFCFGDSHILSHHGVVGEAQAEAEALPGCKDMLQQGNLLGYLCCFTRQRRTKNSNPLCWAMCAIGKLMRLNVSVFWWYFTHLHKVPLSLAVPF